MPGSDLIKKPMLTKATLRARHRQLIALRDIGDIGDIRRNDGDGDGAARRSHIRRAKTAAAALGTAMLMSACINVPVGSQQAAMQAQPGSGLAPKAVLVVPADLRQSRTTFRGTDSCSYYWFSSRSGRSIVNSLRDTLMGAYPEVVVDDGVSDVNPAGPADRYVLTGADFSPNLQIGASFMGTTHVALHLEVTPEGHSAPTVRETLTGSGSDSENGACHAAALALSRASQDALHQAMVTFANSVINRQADAGVIQTGLR